MNNNITIINDWHIICFFLIKYGLLLKIIQLYIFNIIYTILYTKYTMYINDRYVNNYIENKSR